MKLSTVVWLGLSLGLGACQADSAATEESAENVQLLDPNQIQVGPIRHDSLSREQLTRITRIQTTFAEVYPVSLAETIDNFKRDADPDGEIAVWETMSAAYQQYLRGQPRPLSLPQRKEVFGLLLSRTMMPPDDALRNAKLRLLTTAEAEKVLACYEAAPRPMVVR